MPKTATPKDRYMYWLDNNFSRGPHSLIKWLGILSIVCICLLYTSPSPRDRTRSRMPSSA